jgi:hypothetical protein
VSERRYGEDDRPQERWLDDDAGMRRRAGRECARDERRYGSGSAPGGASARWRREDPDRDGWGRDEDYGSGGHWQGPPGSGAAHESGYGQQPTHARGGYGEGSGFTDAGHGLGYATGFGPDRRDPRPQGQQLGSRWSREQTHGVRERDDETTRTEGWAREREGWARERGASARDPRMRNRGPKAYKRSDERVQEDIYERLIDAWEIDSSDVTVEVREGKVTLQGSVPERRMKHRIEDLVDVCHGVRDIDNFIRVRRRGEDGWAAAPCASMRGEAQPASASGNRGAGSSSAEPADGSATGKA